MPTIQSCPYHQKNKLRADLPPLPRRIANLPIGKNGYPIPFFVDEVNGEREDFRIADGKKWVRCVKERLCWVCGEPCGVHLAFVIGPMCTVNRISADPFMHFECAMFSVKACPFLVRPNMVRREDELTAKADEVQRGIMIKRNPGVMALWTTRTFKLVPDHKGGALIKIGEPESITWWREGRGATRTEILASIESGLPFLREVCQNPKEHKALDEEVKNAMRLLPEK